MTKKIGVTIGIVSSAAVLAIAISTAYMFGFYHKTHQITFVGDGITLEETSKKTMSFKPGDNLSYTIKSNEGYMEAQADDVKCEFGSEKQVYGETYNYDTTTGKFTINDAPDKDITVSVLLNKIEYEAKWIAPDGKFKVTGPEKFYFGDKLEFDIEWKEPTNDTSDYPDDMYVYFGGEIQTKGDTYTYTKNSNTAKVIIKSAPAKQITLAYTKEGHHIVYFVGSKCQVYEGEKAKGYRYAQEVNASEKTTITIKADNDSELLLLTDYYAVYSGQDDITGSKDIFKLEFSEEKKSATITFDRNKITTYTTLYFNAYVTQALYEYDVKDNYAFISKFNRENLSESKIVLPDYCYYQSENGESRLIPVTGISENAFKKNKPEDDEVELSEVVFGENIKYVEANAFNGLTELKKLDLKNAQYLGESAFEGCEALTLSSYVKTLRGIGDHCFKGCIKMSPKDFKNAAANSNYPLIISSGNSGKGFDIDLLGEDICEGWSNEQSILFAGDYNRYQLLNKLGYNIEKVKTPEGDVDYYHEVEGGTRHIGSCDLLLSFTDLNSMTWEEISNISATEYNGHSLAYYLWNLGDYRMSFKEEGAEEYKIRIIDFDHDYLVDEGGTRTGKKAGITFELATTWNEYVPIDRDDSGAMQKSFYEKDESLKKNSQYSTSLLRYDLVEDTSSKKYKSVKDNDLLSTLIDYVKPVEKKTLEGYGATMASTSTETLFPLSLNEIGSIDESESIYDIYSQEGTTYSYYIDHNESKRIKNKNTTSPDDQCCYWLRSTDINKKDGELTKAYYIDKEGKKQSVRVNTNAVNLQLSFAFCI